MDSSTSEGIGPGEVEITGWPVVVFAYLIYKAFVVLITGKVKMRTNIVIHK